MSQPANVNNPAATSEPKPLVTTFRVGKSKKASAPGDHNTLKLVAKPITTGIPNVVDDNFERAIAAAKQGGEPLQAYFDAMNKTADFWGFMAKNAGEHQNPFVPGTDAQGNPIMMASSGNVDMRYGAFYRQPDKAQAADGEDDVPVIGIATTETHETTHGLSKTLSFAVGIAGIPPGLVLGTKFFQALLKPLYQNIKTWYTSNARNMQENIELEEGVDPEAVGSETAAEASEVVEDGGVELAEVGVEYVTIEWGIAAGSFAGLAVLAAIPFILQYIAHKMIVSVQVINKTDYDFKWSLYQAHGKTSVEPAKDTEQVIPKMSTYTDTWGDKTSIKTAYEANFQFINSTDLTSIGNVITLQPVSTGTPGVDLVTAIPFDGENTIWVGEASQDPAHTYNQHSGATGQLAVSHDTGEFKVTSSITKLRGKTDDQYFYGVMVVIE